MNISILYGGDSAERKISMQTGLAVAGAIHKNHNLDLINPSENYLSLPKRLLGADLVFNALHGGNGENGNIQSLDRPQKGAESRFNIYNESEANLLGVAFTQSGIMTSAPYQVIDDSHWVFEGTGLSKNDLFGEESLHERIPGGASGHETDKITPSSPANVHLLAKGTNIDEGGAEMVIYETNTRGMVFSAGSITYISSILVDDAISKITSNVLKRFCKS